MKVTQEVKVSREQFKTSSDLPLASDEKESRVTKHAPNSIFLRPRSGFATRVEEGQQFTRLLASKRADRFRDAEKVQGGLSAV